MKSNCLLEALKAKLKDSSVRILVYKSDFDWTPHIMWRDKSYLYDFHTEDRNLPIWKTLCFEGEIRVKKLRK